MVYKAAYNEQQNAVVLTEVEDAVVPAGEGIILKGTEGASVTITPSAKELLISKTTNSLVF